MSQTIIASAIIEIESVKQNLTSPKMKMSEPTILKKAVEKIKKGKFHYGSCPVLYVLKTNNYGCVFHDYFCEDTTSKKCQVHPKYKPKLGIIRYHNYSLVILDKEDFTTNNSFQEEPLVGVYPFVVRATISNKTKSINCVLRITEVQKYSHKDWIKKRFDFNHPLNNEKHPALAVADFFGEQL